MKKVAIITIYSRLNYGNRLQNYAVQEVLKEINVEPYTIKNISKFGVFRKKLDKQFEIGEQITTKNCIYQAKREKFLRFNAKYLNIFEKEIDQDNIENNKNILKDFDYFIVGSDQVWNYNIKSLSELNFLPYIDSDNKIAFAASLSVDEIPDEFRSYYKDNLSKFKAISVRERKGSKILEDLIEKDVPVIIDPILMLEKKAWENIMTKPINFTNKKYILIYMISNKRIDDTLIDECNKKRLELVDVNSINSKYFLTDPSEFIYILKNAEYIITDSYHAAILSIIFNRRCRLYKRSNNYSGMNCRIDTVKEILSSNFYDENNQYIEFIYNDDIYKNKQIIEETQKAKVFLKKYIKN